MTIYNNITELIGQTPIVKLNNIVPEGAADVYVKLEAFNPGSSVKDRIALSMIEKAEQDGILKPGATIVEATSGNTGIGLSWVGAAKGYKVVIVMPETMSVERRKIIQAYGAELVLTPGSEGMKGAIAKAQEIAAEAAKDPAVVAAKKALDAVEGGSHKYGEIKAAYDKAYNDAFLKVRNVYVQKFQKIRKKYLLYPD